MIRSTNIHVLPQSIKNITIIQFLHQRGITNPQDESATINLEKKSAMKLPYKIKSYSSQSSANSISNILSDNNESWESERFCSYPQEITVIFYQPVHINKLKIISHNNKISSRINILYLPASSSHHSGSFQKYGYVTFSQNVENNFQGREMKVLNDVNISAIEVRFLFMHNYGNLYNFFNQIAISCIAFQGQTSNQPMLSTFVLPNKSISLQFLQNKIKLLSQFKQKFIENQQYESAKQIKEIEKIIYKVELKLHELEAEKKTSIKNQNYSQAKSVKAEIDKIKEHIVYVVNNFYDPDKKTIKSSKNDEMLRDKIESLKLYQNNDYLSKSNLIKGKLQNNSSVVKNIGFEEHENQFMKDEEEIASAGQEQDEEEDKLHEIHQSRMTYISHDDKIIPTLLKTKHNATLHNSKASEHAKGTLEHQTDNNQFFEQPNSNQLPDQPQPLTPSNQANSSHLLQFYDNLYIRKLHSKFWQFKSQALTEAVQQTNPLQSTSLQKNKLRCFLFIYSIGIKSSNFQIVNLALELMGHIVTMKLEDSQQKHQLNNQMEKSIILTMMKLHQNNQKIKNQTQKMLLKIIESSIFGAHACYNAITKSYQQKASAKIRKVKLQSLEHLVEKYSIGGSGNTIPYSIADFAVKAASDQDNQVRKSATNLLKAIKNRGGKDRLAIVMEEHALLKSSVLKEFQKP